MVAVTLTRRYEPVSDQSPGDHAETGPPGREEQRAERREKPPERPEVRRPVPFTQFVGRVVVAAVAVLFLVFTLINRHEVTVDWVLRESQVSLIVLLLGSFLLGVVVGSGWFWRRQRARATRVVQDEAKR